MKMVQNLIKKPPVVVILGHIDSGKTSLLNAFRRLQFTEKKPGGVITQHIGAYQIEKEGKKITFIDTPGHEAFSQMRSRGAKVADIALLVIDAIEGIKEQTKEAIGLIKKISIPTIIVINKIDKPGANPAKIKINLKKEGILVEDLGGKIPALEVSAKTRQGIEDLLDLIFLLAEMENLQSDPKKTAEGVIIESYLDAKRGPIASLILEQGRLKIGDIVATPTTLGKVKKLENSLKKELKEIVAGDPALLLGLEKTPLVGEKIKVFSSLDEAQKIIKREEKKEKEKIFAVQPEQKILNLIIKANALGSLEAIEEIIKSLPSEKVMLKILERGVGDVSENDVELARIAKGVVLGFKVKISPPMKNFAQKEKIKIKIFNVIYELVDEVRKMIERFSRSETTRVELGKLKVLVVFWQEKNRQIVGGKIIEGQIERGSKIEIIRDNEVIGNGKIVNLQKNKKNIELGKRGEEVGILFEGNEKIEKGDLLVFYKEERLTF